MPLPINAQKIGMGEGPPTSGVEWRTYSKCNDGLGRWGTAVQTQLWTDAEKSTEGLADSLSSDLYVQSSLLHLALTF